MSEWIPSQIKAVTAKVIGNTLDGYSVLMNREQFIEWISTGSPDHIAVLYLEGTDMKLCLRDPGAYWDGLK